jgi:hypothetical protein
MRTSFIINSFNYFHLQLLIHASNANDVLLFLGGFLYYGKCVGEPALPHYDSSSLPCNFVTADQHVSLLILEVLDISANICLWYLLATRLRLCDAISTVSFCSFPLLRTEDGLIQLFKQPFHGTHEQ